MISADQSLSASTGAGRMVAAEARHAGEETDRPGPTEALVMLASLLTSRCSCHRPREDGRSQSKSRGRGDWESTPHSRSDDDWSSTPRRSSSRGPGGDPSPWESRGGGDTPRHRGSSWDPLASPAPSPARPGSGSGKPRHSIKKCGPLACAQLVCR